MTEEVTKWLEGLGLGQYAETFEDNAIDWDVLVELDHEVLKDIGVTAAGHRLRILKAAKAHDRENAFDLSSPASAPEQITPLSGEAERRQLTVMFCDLVGSTQLSQQLDPEDLRQINREYQDACKSAIERYEGYVAPYMGDGVLAYFGYPQAHEDDAERAIHAGLGVVESVMTLSTPTSKDQTMELGVRVGIASESTCIEVR